MRISQLYVRQFRNLDTQTVILNKGLNAYVGDNAEGKTSLLEALHMFILGSSFRTRCLKDMVRHGENAFFIEAEVISAGVSQTIGIRYDGERRHISLNGIEQEHSSSLLGSLLGVTMSMDDLDLIYGPPALRRRFLDEQIAQIDPYYVEQLRRYNRALAQRNVLLRSHTSVSIAAWEEILAQAGAYITIQRRETYKQLRPLVQTLFNTLFDGIDLDMRYVHQLPDEVDPYTWYRDQYVCKRGHEEKVGCTLVGPHRDDIEWLLQEYSVKVSASFGQARAVVCALRCAEWHLLQTRSGEIPLLLIDDCDSAFDETRTSLLYQSCQECEQIIITAHKRPTLQHHTTFSVQSGVVYNDDSVLA